MSCYRPALVPALLLSHVLTLGVLLAQDVDTVLSDAEFFAALDLSPAALAPTAAAVQAGDMSAARRALADYYRQRTGVPYEFDPHQVDRAVAGGDVAVKGIAPQLAGEGFFAARTAEGDLQWVGNPHPGRYPTRMYWWDALGKAYWATGDEAYARQWLWQLRSFVRQCPAPTPGQPPGSQYWNTMDAGIRLRGSWPAAFHYFLHSPTVTPDDLVLFLKSTMEQARFIQREHRGSTNWVTFAMVGLYSAGAVFPECREAESWRRHAAGVAVDEMQRLYLPDGFGNELSPGYHSFFTNFWTLQEIARRVGRESDITADLYALSEAPVAVTMKLMTPDRSVPRFNDSGAVDVPGFLRDKLVHYPGRADLAWIASDGASGEPPAFTSHLFDHAGYAIMRSGWERNATYVAFDVGPPGNSHVHQDKLNLVMWAYGREILFDIGAAAYDESVWRRYSVDTHAHNTILIDGRPQRRRWQRPNPVQMPYKPLDDLRWTTTPAWDAAAGIYEEAYGAVGMPEYYPYRQREAFRADWARPATHERRVLFLKPDLVVVGDLLTPSDEASHRYQARWHLLSTRTTPSGPTGGVQTADPDQPNLMVLPLLTDGLEVATASAQTEPELLGWNALGNDRNTPTTTITHTLTAAGPVRLLTLLVPLLPGQADPVTAVEAGPEAGAVTVRLADGRRLTLAFQPGRLGGLTARETRPDGTPGRVVGP